ncbi:MAG: bifunctional aspartate kinase/diaminopimelate decarboxylase [Proteobacteria bacterium]|nr:bifunctional aspartate kinase/diaminopimelate decarboxylase [Pseudomonadota bacterium]
MQNNWVVIKFGGTSVATAENWRHIASIVQQHRKQDRRVLVVCSALTQVSNKLEALLKLALSGSYVDALKELEAIHQVLCQDLGVDFTLLDVWFKRLQQLAEGVSLIQEASPRIRALVMAHGELLSTTIGAFFLRSQNLAVDWQDARELLQAENDPIQHHSARYLMAYCHSNPEPDLLEKISGLAPVVITQGFIARNSANETVLLGRGGSDTSAAYFAAKIQAQFCEIWTDVQGIFTANPKQIPQAHLLSELDYDEAQEIASMGGKVLHPNCIPPLKQQQIPLLVKCTFLPEHPGTKISITDQKTAIKIKSVICKYGISIISIETVRMLHQVGFLANIFNCFKQRGLSIDLISTSESSVTVSLDNVRTAGDAQLIQLLLQDLSAFGNAQLTGPCASVSLIGHYIRSSLPKLGEVFELFAQHQIYMLSQAANDLNLTFVVDEDQAERLAQKIHALLIEPAYRLEELKIAGLALKETWWQKDRQRLLALMETHRQPLYVYDQATLQQQANRLLSCHAIDAIYYSLKANNHPDILKLFYSLGLNFECVSIDEVKYLLNLFPEINRSKILFTPNFALKAEYQQAFNEKILVTVDNLYPLKNWPEVFAGQDIILRIDPGEGYGHHHYVCTGGTDSKFGISLNELTLLLELLAQQSFKVVGLHAHVGSGILREQTWKENFLALSALISYFPDIRVINIGGGLGIAENSGQKSLNIKAIDDSLSPAKVAFPNIQIWIEPGRFLVAEAGVLLARVTQIKQKNDVIFIGIETGMNSLIRPALYGSYHEIVNLTRLGQAPAISAHITGPICESGDILGYSRILPETFEGDVMLIANTGAYGRVMSSYYNMREPAREFFLA